jgi:hypothetical protein
VRAAPNATTSPGRVSEAVWTTGLGRRRNGCHSAVPVIERLLDEVGRDCYRAWCPCGWTTAPFLSIEPAQIDAWQHAFPNRVSDLRGACATHPDAEAPVSARAGSA